MKKSILFALFLPSCQCPPKGSPDAHCKYIGPTISLVGGFNGVQVGVKLWNPADLSAASMPSLQLPTQSITGAADSEILSAKFTK